MSNKKIAKANRTLRRKIRKILTIMGRIPFKSRTIIYVKEIRKNGINFRSRYAKKEEYKKKHTHAVTRFWKNFIKFRSGAYPLWQKKINNKKDCLGIKYILSNHQGSHYRYVSSRIGIIPPNELIYIKDKYSFSLFNS